MSSVKCCQAHQRDTNNSSHSENQSSVTFLQGGGDTGSAESHQINIVAALQRHTLLCHRVYCANCFRTDMLDNIFHHILTLVHLSLTKLDIR